MGTLGIVLSIIGGLVILFASLIIIVWWMLKPIYDQVSNHLPTEVKGLKEDVRAINSRLDKLFELIQSKEK